MKQGKIANAAFAVSALALAGCMVGPDYVEPSFKIAEEELMKEHFSRDEGLWKTALPADSLPKGDWWKVFNDKTLDSLLKQCRENSPDLKAAFWRVEQARETALMDQSDLYPQLNGNASYSRTGTSRNAKSYSGTYDNWAAGFGITWDLDLFGRIRSIIESDVAEAQASLDAYENLMLLMQAQVATLYFTIRQYSSEIELLERTVKVRKDQTQYVARRLKYGEANDVDMQRALQEEYDASAQLASVERQMATARNDIAILVGTVPSQLNFKPSPLPETLPQLPAAIPSELLERRPDVAQAERKVYAANARIGAAHAAYFPTISFSADTSLSAEKIDKLINSSSFAWGISPQIYIPIFQAGRIYAQKQVALAAHKEAVENYKSIVLSAIGEVENALAQINYLKREYDKRTDVVKASLKVQDLTQTQYDHGYIDYFSVSDAQRLALSNERAQISLRGDRFKAYVNLISALGGGWVADVQKQDEELRPDLLDPYELSKDKPKPLGEE